MSIWKALTVSSLIILVFLNGPLKAQANQSKQHIEVYKTATCGCCIEWIQHLEETDYFSTVFHPEDINELKRQKGIKPQYQSCHTGISKNGHIFEGHIPARFIKEYLKNPVSGSIRLSVPGMPVGSPGMEIGAKFLPYRILTLMEDGSVKIFKHIEKMDDQYSSDQAAASLEAKRGQYKTSSK